MDAVCTLCEDADEGRCWWLGHLENGAGRRDSNSLGYKEPVGDAGMRCPKPEVWVGRRVMGKGWEGSLCCG